MLIYVGFDDTDTADSDRGTGRLARMYGERLPDGCILKGVVRQQLPVMDGIPYTSHNSSACLIVETDKPGIEDTLIESAARHLAEHFIEGSDPGLCVAPEQCLSRAEIIAFSLECCRRIVRREDARSAAGDVHLSGHGGTNDGIIGAIAGVGLSMYGWSGRFIEYGNLRDFPSVVSAGELERCGIRVLPVNRDAIPLPADAVIDTGGWLRPRLWAGQAVLPVENTGEGRWHVLGRKEERDGYQNGVQDIRA